MSNYFYIGTKVLSYILFKNNQNIFKMLSFIENILIQGANVDLSETE